MSNQVPYATPVGLLQTDGRLTVTQAAYQRLRDGKLATLPAYSGSPRRS